MSARARVFFVVDSKAADARAKATTIVESERA